MAQHSSTQMAWPCNKRFLVVSSSYPLTPFLFDCSRKSIDKEICGAMCCIELTYLCGRQTLILSSFLGNTTMLDTHYGYLTTSRKPVFHCFSISTLLAKAVSFSQLWQFIIFPYSMMENLAMVAISFTSPGLQNALGLDLFWCKRYYGAYTLRIGSSSFTWDIG